MKTPLKATFKTIFGAGDVVKVFYFLNLTKFRKIFTFVGFCINFNKKSKTFTLQNFYGPEFLIINFILGSPNIVAIDLLQSYNFSSRLSKLYHFKKLRLSVNTDILSSKRVYKKKDPLDHIYKLKMITHHEKKRLRNKFRV